MEANAPGASGGDGKTLVVYYSAIGSTEAVAGYIAGATSGDLFEIVPAEPYTHPTARTGRRRAAG